MASTFEWRSEKAGQPGWMSGEQGNLMLSLVGPLAGGFNVVAL